MNVRHVVLVLLALASVPVCAAGDGVATIVANRTTDNPGSCNLSSCPPSTSCDRTFFWEDASTCLWLSCPDNASCDRLIEKMGMKKGTQDPQLPPVAPSASHITTSAPLNTPDGSGSINASNSTQEDVMGPPKNNSSSTGGEGQERPTNGSSRNALQEPPQINPSQSASHANVSTLGPSMPTAAVETAGDGNTSNISPPVSKGPNGDQTNATMAVVTLNVTNATTTTPTTSPTTGPPTTMKVTSTGPPTTMKVTSTGPPTTMKVTSTGPPTAMKVPSTGPPTTMKVTSTGPPTTMKVPSTGPPTTTIKVTPSPSTTPKPRPSTPASSQFVTSTLPSTTGSQTTPRMVEVPSGAGKAMVEVAGGELTSQVMNTSSLLAVLIFGLLFFVVTVVLFLRHAYESYKRRDYTQVDYLINGMYNDSGL